TGEAAIDADRQIRLRIGVHLADVIADEIDLYGDGVNLAARLRDLGGPQEIIISAAVRDQLADGLGVTIEDLSEHKLKGIDRPMAELTEAGRGRVIWAENFDGSMNDVFDLQDRLSQDIASRAMPFVRQMELQRARSKRPEDLSAYEWTLRGIDHFHRSSHDDM